MLFGVFFSARGQVRSFLFFMFLVSKRLFLRHHYKGNVEVMDEVMDTC